MKEITQKFYLKLIAFLCTTFNLVPSSKLEEEQMRYRSLLQKYQRIRESVPVHQYPEHHLGTQVMTYSVVFCLLPEQLDNVVSLQVVADYYAKHVHRAIMGIKYDPESSV